MTAPPTADYLTVLATKRTDDYQVTKSMSRCLGDQLIMEVGALPTVVAMWISLTECFECSDARAAHLYLQAWTTWHNGAL